MVLSLEIMVFFSVEIYENTTEVHQIATAQVNLNLSWAWQGSWLVQTAQITHSTHPVKILGHFTATYEPRYSTWAGR